MKRMLLYFLIAFIAYYFIHKYLRRMKYVRFFTDMGFSEYYLKNFTTDELFTAWNYINNYSRKGIKLTPNVDIDLYNKVVALNNKWKVKSGAILFTNI